MQFEYMNITMSIPVQYIEYMYITISIPQYIISSTNQYNHNTG